MRLFNKAVACGLAVTLVMTCNGPSDTALAAKKESLSKKNVTLTVGKTATVKVKNASKAVKWSTNKKKIATVTASGKKKATAKIKGVSAGKATITAKVGTKKLSCKVTVKKAVSKIKSVSVDPLDTSCVVLTMKKATPVNVSDLVVAKKNYKEGSYNYKPTIKTIASADQITYRIYLDSSIAKGDWLKVTYNKTDSVEQQYINKVYGYTMTEYVKKGKLTKEYASQYFSNTVGTVQYSLVSGKLPEGMTLNTKRGVIKGIPTTAGSYKFTIQAKDELGRSAKATLTYNIYDETVLMVPNTSLNVRLDDYVDARVADTTTNTPGVSYYESTTIRPYGGSGKYTFALAATDVPNVRLSTDVKDANGQVVQESAATSQLYVPYEITEGEHTYSVTVTDVQNPSLIQTINVTVIAKKYYNITGTAKDSLGSDLTGNELYFYPVGSTSSESYVRKVGFTKDTYEGANTYDVKNYNYTSTVGSSSADAALAGDKRGTYAAELPAGEYIVKINSDADDIRYQMNDHVVVTADGMQPVTAPIRFYSVSAVATYANGNPIANTKVYFEMKDRQYETRESSDMNFSVTTDERGMFIASLPANKYAAYVIDSDGNREYFTTDVKVTDADVTLNEFKVAIERYMIEGTASRVSSYGNPTIMKNTTLRVYDEKGVYSSIMTTETGTFKIGVPGNATYTIKAYINGTWRVLGAVTVTNANVTGQNLMYSFDTEMALATPLALGTDTPVTVTGSGVAIAKFECTESGYYNVEATGAYTDNSRLYVYSKDSEYLLDNSQNYNSSKTTVSSVRFTKGNTYYIMFIPENNSEASSNYCVAMGNYTLKVTQQSKIDDSYYNNYSDDEK